MAAAAPAAGAADNFVSRPSTKTRVTFALSSKIGALARGLDDRDAFVLYPEGHDFTERLRLRVIASLRRRGHHRAADRAESWEYVLPPRHKVSLAGARDAVFGQGRSAGAAAAL